MKKQLVILFILTTLIISSCHEYYFDSGYPCDFCYTEKPEEGLLTIKLTVNGENPFIPIIIYQDELDYQETVWVDTTNEESYEILVPIDNNYTVTAEYKSGDKIITAVDATKIHMKENTSDCEEDCWIVFDGTVDLTLKY